LAKKKNVEKAPREMTHRQLSHHKKAQRRQRIILFSGISIIVAVILIILGGWFAGEYLPLHKTIIQVYDTKFDTSYLIDSLVLFSKMQNTTDLAGITNDAVSIIMQDELMKQEAEKLGISISDEEATQYWGNSGISVTDAAMNFARGQLLPARLKSGHFSSLIPESDNQVDMRAMMVESDTLAKVVRERIANGENFTILAEKYATNYYSKTNQGDYGWHPASILKNQLGSTIPLDYAFSPDVKAGDLSMPLSDNASSKQLGYWLIRVNDRPDVESANVSAILLSNEVEALNIKARLEAGEELAAIADKLSQYSPSKANHGELGLVTTSENVTDTLNGYVLNPSTEVGKWSQPVREDTLGTQGGVWLVQVVGKEENKQLTTEDRNTLIDNSFSKWFSDFWAESLSTIRNDITAEIQQWAIDRAVKELQQTKG
jgi:parvulin-like peptidyl-prolyl isomerase